MNYNVTSIEFDFDDDYADTVCNSDLDTFFIASEVDRKEVTERHLGVWEADDEEKNKHDDTIIWESNMAMY